MKNNPSVSRSSTQHVGIVEKAGAIKDPTTSHFAKGFAGQPHFVLHCRTSRGKERSNMWNRDASNDPEAVLSVYEASGVPKWAIRQCLEGNETTGYILNNRKLSKLLAVVANNTSYQDEIE